MVKFNWKGEAMKANYWAIVLGALVLVLVFGCATKIACSGARCCKYTYTQGGIQYVKYYSFPVCPDYPAFKDVGPCPVCPP
jgi:hypothetical protein